MVVNPEKIIVKKFEKSNKAFTMSMPLGRVIDATTQKVYGDLSMMVDL